MKKINLLLILLEILNERFDEYIPYDEIKTEFLNKLKKGKEYDETGLEKKLKLMLLEASGLYENIHPSGEVGKLI